MVAGGQPDAFWVATPRQIHAVLKAWGDLEGERFKIALRQQWIGASWVRDGVPSADDLDRMLNGPPSGDVTAEQASDNLRLWQATLKAMAASETMQ